MTKGIINRDIASKLHKDILPLIAVTAFTLHISWSAHLSLIRWKIWNKVTKIVWIVFCLLVFSTFIYLDVFYKPASSSKKQLPATTGSAKLPTTENKPEDSLEDETNPPTKVTQTPILKDTIFTTIELAEFDGKNGNLAYVAVDGNVYDLTTVFINGVHKGHNAGQDLSQAFHDQHMQSILSKFTVVGVLQN
ncbi:MAG: Cytochrome b5 [uncultured bacterium]|nr:MAG: Cytochrome b5 [uncultured bacterium]